MYMKQYFWQCFFLLQWMFTDLFKSQDVERFFGITVLCAQTKVDKQNSVKCTFAVHLLLKKICCSLYQFHEQISTFFVANIPSSPVAFTNTIYSLAKYDLPLLLIPTLYQLLNISSILFSTLLISIFFFGWEHNSKIAIYAIGLWEDILWLVQESVSSAAE